MDLLGGQYPADQNADGTWNIRGVPIFGENRRTFKRGGKTVELVVDRDWLEDAVKFAETQAQGGYVAPLHVRHNGDSSDVEHIGFVKPTHVATADYHGSPTVMMFADYLSVPEHAFERFKRRQMPYVSVECPFDERRIYSAAILTHEEPFLRLPMQTIGAETPYVLPSVVVDQTPVTAGASLVAAFNAPKGASFLSRFDGGAPVKYVTEEQLAERFAEQQSQFAALLDEKLAKFAAKPDEDQADDADDQDDDDETVTEPGDDGVVNGPVGAEDVNNAQFGAQAAAMQAKIDALAGKVEAREEKDAVEARYSAAVADLESDGYHLTASAKTSIRKFAKYGEQTLTDYVASFRETVLPDPPTDLSGLTAGGRGRGSADSEAVAQFAAGDPEKLAFAREAVGRYAQLKAAVPNYAVTEADFIQTSYRAQGAA